jgi:hypothetical protein
VFVTCNSDAGEDSVSSKCPCLSTSVWKAYEWEKVSYTTRSRFLFREVLSRY